MQESDFLMARFEAGVGEISVRVHAFDAKAWQAWHLSRLRLVLGLAHTEKPAF